MAWSLVAPSVRDASTRSSFDKTWRQYSKALGPLKHFEQPACSHGIQILWKQLGWVELTKCFVNASFERADATVMIDLNETGKSWEIIGFSAFQTPSQGWTNDDPGFEVTQVGIFEKPKSSAAIEDPNSPSGSLLRPPEVAQLIRETTVIPAKKGVNFGVAYSFRNASILTPISSRVVWRFPSSGLLNPRHKTPTYEYIHTTVSRGGLNSQTYAFDEDWEIVPGIWTLELWHGEKRLYHQEFQVVSDR